MLLARPPASCVPAWPPPLPPLPFSAPRTSFRHPAYPDHDSVRGSNVLFSLPPIDGGVHHGTALVACFIFAGNTNGFLSLLPDRLQHVALDADFDAVLKEPNYYYHLVDDEGDDHPYPVCPSFAHWTFPTHPTATVPAEWSAVFAQPTEQVVAPAPSQMTTAVVQRDRTCRLTDTSDVCQNAHLVPTAQLAWFQRNNIRAFNLNSALSKSRITDDIRNGILLRQDLHTALDAGKFTFVIKNSKLVAHFLQPTSDLGRQFHNCEVRAVNDARVEFYFARFAYSMFPFVEEFASAPSTWVRRGNGTVEMNEAPTTPTCTRPGLKRKHPSVSSSSTSSRAQPSQHSHDDPSEAPPTPTDSDTEYQEDLRIASQYFPTMLHDPLTTTPDNDLWENITFYPGQRKIERLKEKWRREQRVSAGPVMCLSWDNAQREEHNRC